MFQLPHGSLFLIFLYKDIEFEVIKFNLCPLIVDYLDVVGKHLTLNHLAE